jgi:hypothetical protein
MSYRERRRADDKAAREWTGGYRSYDIVKEAAIAVGAVLALAVVLTILFSSPDERPSTVQSWARTMPTDFVATAISELDGTSGTAGYGPPYNHGSTGQHELFLDPQKWLGVSHPLDAGKDFVIAPLRSITGQPALQRAVTTYQSATITREQAWANAYATALGRTGAHATATGSISVPNGSYGPVPAMMTGLLRFAQSGGLDGALLTSGQFYQTDYTKPLMFLADGGLLAQRAQADHLLGTQWGMMNETGSYPGQVWLWLYTFWYQIKPFSTSENADILVMTVMAALSLAFVLIPFIPGVSDLPRRIPIYRLIWRDHYRALDTSADRPAPTPVART